MKLRLLIHLVNVSLVIQRSKFLPVFKFIRLSQDMENTRWSVPYMVSHQDPTHLWGEGSCVLLGLDDVAVLACQSDSRHVIFHRTSDANVAINIPLLHALPAYQCVAMPIINIT